MEIRSNNKAKHRSQKFAFGIFRLLSLCIVLILFAILGFIVYKGIGAISWDFITSAPTDGMTGGGIWPAIVGTFYLMVGSALFAFPIGVMSGIYMNEYAPKGKLVRFIRVMTNNLSGIPSIVFGLFGMALFVNYMGFGDSILAGSLTLGLLCVPLVIRTTEEALKAIPDSMREGSRALGATKLQTIWHVILPMGMPNRQEYQNSRPCSLAVKKLSSPIGSPEQLSQQAQRPPLVPFSVAKRPHIPLNGDLPGFQVHTVYMQLPALDGQLPQLGIQADGTLVKAFHIRDPGQQQIFAVFQYGVVIGSRNDGFLHSIAPFLSSSGSPVL